MVTTAKAPECGTCHRLSFPAIGSIATAMLLVYAHADAAEWKITPNLNLKETYTDNVSLAPPGQEKSDFITQITPGISLTGTGARLKLNANYSMQNLVYAEESSRNTMNHLLNANANAELIDDLFFLDGRAAISQQNISLLGPQATDNVNTTGNRTEVQTYSVSPYLRHKFSNFASTEVRYTHDEVSTGGSGLANSQADRVQLSLNSGSAFDTLGWGLSYSNGKTSYANTANIHPPTTDTEILTGSLHYSVTPKFRLTATSGYEKNNYISTGIKPEGSFWSAGFSWAPSARTSIDASTGKRYFGDSYSLAASHRTRLTAWSLGYSEDITSTRSQFLVPTDQASVLDLFWATYIPGYATMDPVTRYQNAQKYIDTKGLPPELAALAGPVNYLTNSFFLQKSLKASVAMMGAKNALILSLFSTSRDAQTSLTQDSILFGNSSLAQNDRTKQVGGSAAWNFRIDQRTSANVNLVYSRNSFPSLGRTDNNKTIRLSLSRRLQPKLDGTVELRRIQLDSSQAGSGYSENALTASLFMRF
ncbi:MAG: TIGR03016 family PEP-CTERM system-associated outer membrane protein [Gammaproteobacteria bacterium]|nr:TIGR03016 family PEP-CTERM system-associated outer membrane protein [Gammaproteobacteria bacterium]MBU1977830.1 TIGR03016 family PEP-CTERM system-associated outer membrane protein [Gammaproteobacteria bacterium]